MFSPNIVGTANAFAGGWGNMGEWMFQHLTLALYCSNFGGGSDSQVYHSNN